MSKPRGNPQNLRAPGTKLDWTTFDQVAVDRLVSGWKLEAKTVDYWEAVRVLVARGRTDAAVAVWLGKDYRTIQRIHNRLIEQGRLPERRR